MIEHQKVVSQANSFKTLVQKTRQPHHTNLLEPLCAGQQRLPAIPITSKILQTSARRSNSTASCNLRLASHNGTASTKTANTNLKQPLQCDLHPWVQYYMLWFDDGGDVVRRWCDDVWCGDVVMCDACGDFMMVVMVVVVMWCLIFFTAIFSVQRKSLDV